MTKVEELKKLLKNNLNELNIGLNLGLSIFFDDIYIIISNDENGIILVDKTINYDLDFENQKRFMLKVASRIFEFVRDDETLEYIKVENAKDLKKVANPNKFINIDKAIVMVKYIDNNKHLDKMANIYYANIDKEEADKAVKFINGAMYI